MQLGILDEPGRFKIHPNRSQAEYLSRKIQYNYSARSSKTARLVVVVKSMYRIKSSRPFIQIRALSPLNACACKGEASCPKDCTRVLYQVTHMARYALQEGDEHDVMFGIARRHVPTSCCLLSRLTSLHFRTSSTTHGHSDQIIINGLSSP